MVLVVNLIENSDESEDSTAMTETVVFRWFKTN